MIGVVVVDDHAILRAGIRSRLEGEPDITVLGEAATADQAIERCAALTPDVVLLDLLLPRRAGCEAIPELLRRSPLTRVLVLSSQAAPSWVRRALTAGAAGYLSKRASDRELATAIRRVASGDGYVEPSLGATLVVDNSQAALEALSERERDVLQLLALGYTNQEIAARLFISVRTVDTHRAHIMLKLRLESRAELVMFSLAHGVIGL
ncbi:MAG TPA: response regulator transcription factor [Solirubrobacteraceae bacterium]|nr:response regulator transcription factor [Solirubrobacteraceae bacterium]